jgi:phage shock protein A
LQNTITEKDQESDRLEGRIVELEVRIGKLNTEKYELCQDFEKKEADKKALNGTI